jgi:hypothetical protein
MICVDLLTNFTENKERGPLRPFTSRPIFTYDMQDTHAFAKSHPECRIKVHTNIVCRTYTSLGKSTAVQYELFLHIAIE